MPKSRTDAELLALASSQSRPRLRWQLADAKKRMTAAGVPEGEVLDAVASICVRLGLNPRACHSDDAVFAGSNTRRRSRVSRRSP